jgi:hypothetical protein
MSPNRLAAPTAMLSVPASEMLPPKFARLLTLDLDAFAWEYMRRSAAYKIAYKRANGENAIELSEEDVALAFGLKKVKDPSEWYFEGPTPRFVALPILRFDFGRRLKIGKPQKHKVALMQGQVALTFDLRHPVAKMLELAKMQLAKQQAAWLRSELIRGVRQRVTDGSASRAEHVRWLRALDLYKLSNHGDVGRKLLGKMDTRKRERDAGRELVKHAEALRDGQYRALVLKFLLQHQASTRRREKRRSV